MLWINVLLFNTTRMRWNKAVSGQTKTLVTSDVEKHISTDVQFKLSLVTFKKA